MAQFPSKSQSSMPGARSKSKFTPSWPLLCKMWRVGSMYFKSGCKYRACFLLGLVLILCALCAGMLVLLSYVQRDFSTALSKKDQEGFHRAIWMFILMVVVATPLFAFYEYMQGLLALEWRIWLTDFLLGDYFTNRAYFDLKMDGKLDNPDQRICEDISNFVANAVGIITLISGKILKIFAFTGVLWSIAPELVFFLFFYSAFGTFFTVRIFGAKVMHLKFQGLQMEADFRYSLVRIRDNAESIAFYSGEKHEASAIQGFFSILVGNTRELLIWCRHLALFSNLYEYAVIIIPSLIIAPRYFSGEVEFGVISQTGFAFKSILTALSMIVLKFENFSGLAAQTERLDGLLEALLEHNHTQLKSKYVEKLSSVVELDNYDDISVGLLRDAESPGFIERKVGAGLVVKNLNLYTPNLQTMLIKNLNLNLGTGESVLIMGASGCGKSSFLRAVAGLWNRGEGLIQGPMQEEAFFLPQKPYMPLGSLREQLLFPCAEMKVGTLDEEKLLRQLEEVALGDLPSKVGGLDAVCDWGGVLSSGEQQRLAFARLFLHEPSVAFLDEATSALDIDTEAMLYSMLEKRIPCYISVGHRSSLKKFHTHVLKVDSCGQWMFYSKKQHESLQLQP
ncbi:hypothetical protein KP509_32G055900 [Ceratopteris richardii]|uniref:Uncharacterized protein n=1 Tax=Ceratopteris richardii TaxID=49495 RepID=A0A8T2QTS8_CERRI|nr:hypothetical protein KP509_32G055900 [Ceratopteris richardii]KAH7287427.1 hypothetical protein KP509_32G055900 [Ceratopteris richardii]KAH7287428.1 hypothetical protein KP509_32G055900 [Ceratopteris richardii]KAH7287429.1 hypothetical protein KP509_32G055900 [Ceratopteris richardii]